MKCENCTNGLQPDWYFCPLCGTSAHQGLSPSRMNLTDEEMSNSFNKPMVSSAEKVPSTGKGSFGSGVRAQVFEVIVRQAIAGAPWHQICAGVMQVNQITTDEVEEEIRRRRGGGNEPPSASVPNKPLPTEGISGIALALPVPSQQLANVRALIKNLGQNCESGAPDMRTQLSIITSQLDSLVITIHTLEQTTNRVESEAQLQIDLERELHRTKQEFKPKELNRPLGF